MKRIALYARVSTLDKGQNPEMQLAELRAFVNARGWTITKEYVDHGVSGAKEQRPALDALWRDAKARLFDCVCVWKLDRFGRSSKHLINSLSEFQELGISFVSLRDGFDLTTPGGRAMFGMVAVMAEFERDLIRERVIAGIAQAKAEGRSWKRGLSKKRNLSRTTLWRRARAAGGENAGAVGQ
jgi:DNA invertase Pin-like site-specific DNA recombinase